VCCCTGTGSSLVYYYISPSKICCTPSPTLRCRAMTNSSFASSLAILSIDYTITTTCAAVLRSIVEDVALGSTLSAQSSSLNTINQHKATIAALSTALHEQEFLHTTATSTITTLLAHIVSLSIPPPTPLPTTLATSPSNDEMWMGLLQEKEEEINNLRQQIADPPPPQPATPPTPAPVDSPPPPLPTTTFTTLTDPTLFTIFGYLDAPDVLAAAAVDRTFFSRVDVMFGINSSINSPQKSRPQTPTTTKAKVAPTSAGGSSLLSRGFSTLTATVNSKLATRTPNPPSTATPDVSMFATSIADKLTAVELKSIIALTDKLRQKDGEIKLVTTENEDLLAKFEGSETVKAFMVDKVKELEVRNESIVGNIMQLQQQIESDKEVIGFVDCR